MSHKRAALFGLLNRPVKFQVPSILSVHTHNVMFAFDIERSKQYLVNFYSLLFCLQRMNESFHALES